MSKIKLIKAGKVVNDILSTNEGLAEIVGTKIYPIGIISGEPQYPYIVFERMNLILSDTKDYTPYGERCWIKIYCFDKKYNNVIDLADKVVDIMLHLQGTYDDIAISNISFVGVEEAMNNDAFVEILTFDMQI